MDTLPKYFNRTSRCFNLYRDSRLDGEGITGCQQPYLMAICRHPGIPQDELAKTIYVNKSSVARQLSLLEQNGFIIRKPCESDRRQLLVYPTQKAQDLLPKIHQVIQDWNRRILEDFTPEETEILLNMLKKIREKAMDIADHPDE
ncbi:MAG: MarR family winged helix-turn-helix transcriptional regulator [Massiliimalia sp.]